MTSIAPELPPGSYVQVSQAAAPLQLPVLTSNWFVAGITQMGPAGSALAVTSMNQFLALYGARLTTSVLYDALDTFFHEGGQQAYVSRVTGPNPVYASVTALDSSSVASIIFTAKSYGTWINNYQIVIAGTGTVTITVEDNNSNVLETWGSFTTQAAIAAYSAQSNYVTATVGTSLLLPAPGTKILVGGTDDYANATDATWLNALNAFNPSMGPGQVSSPGRTTAAAHSNLIAHASANNRSALLDYVDTPTVATLTAAATADAAVSGAEYASAWTPWVTAPGIVSGTTRNVPPSAFAAALMARNDNNGISPNQPSAGPIYGGAIWLLGVSQPPFSEAVAGAAWTLNNAGINLAKIYPPVNGVVTEYGYRTLASPLNPAQWLLLGNQRLVMSIVARAQVIGQNYVFQQIDGLGAVFSELAADLTAMLVPYYNQGSLYGTTQATAFSVNTGPNVNTSSTIAALQIRALIGLSLSPDAEQVMIMIVTTTQTGGVL